MGIQGFEFHDVLENKTYEIGVDDLKIPVTTKEVLDFYPAEHRLKETDIEQYAAAYTARIKRTGSIPVSSTPHSCGGFSTKSG